MKHLQTALHKTLLSILATAFVVMGFTSTAWAQDEGTTVRDTGLNNLQVVTRSSEDLPALAFIVQEGNGGSATIIQEAGQLATGVELGEAHIRQFSGQGNEAFIRQKGAAGPHDHEIVQRGDRNRATIRALVGGHQGTVYQEGTSNIVLLKQAGNNNRGTITQYGSGADAFLRQTGDRNTARILQGINPRTGGGQR